MLQNSGYFNFTRFILFFVFLVILAGGVVRTTQSGMGCPDWPHCFGMWIPPTNASQLPPDYEKYLDKQDIDHSFNVLHTWTEYVNRLLGALLGLFVLIHVVWSFKISYKTHRVIFWLSLLMLFATGFQGWLGKEVVDANLAVIKITIHMLMALAIAMIPVIIIHKLKAKEIIKDSGLKWLLTAALVVLVVQIIMGTNVREQVDEVSKSLNYIQRELWLTKLNFVFDAHKLVAALTSIICIAVFWRSLSYTSVQKTGFTVLLLTFLIIALGLIMANFNIPSFAQPLHLLFSCALFVTLFYLRLNFTD